MDNRRNRLSIGKVLIWVDESQLRPLPLRYRLPRRPWTALVVMGVIAVILLPAFVLAELQAPVFTVTPAERRLLEELAVQAGVAAHAVRLTTDLQRFGIARCQCRLISQQFCATLVAMKYAINLGACADLQTLCKGDNRSLEWAL